MYNKLNICFVKKKNIYIYIYIHQTSPRDSPDDFEKSKKNKNIYKKNLYEIILLINLSQTAYFDGLTLSDDRKWYGDSTGLNTVSYTHLTLPTNSRV